MLESTGLIGREVASEAIELDQVARLNAKGKETKRGAGQATVKFSYAMDKIPVRGAGAKSLVFAEPDNGDIRFAGAFHAWRNPVAGQPVKLPPIDEALGVGLLVDPELVGYHEAGHKIRINRLELGYLALPAFLRQTHLFPAFEVEGEVLKGERGPGFRFARYHHAVPPKAYEEADIFGPYLTVNPDGIAPTSAAAEALSNEGPHARALSFSSGRELPDVAT